MCGRRNRGDGRIGKSTLQPIKTINLRGNDISNRESAVVIGCGRWKRN